LSAPHVSLETWPDASRNSREAVSGMIRLLRRHRPRIVHLQFTPFLGALPWLARLSGVEKVYFTDQGSRPEGYEAGAKPAWKRIAARIINVPLTGVIGVSDYNCRNMAAEGLIPASRIHRVYNSIEIARVREDGRGAEFRRRHAIPLDRILVTQTSWLIPEKGIADMLAAARLALDEEPALHFAFIGEGAFGEQYAALARDMGLGDRVAWTGLVRDPIGEGAFAAADIVCQMSRWEEAFGMVIAEAMAFSKPVVATRVGGIPEVVRDGETGFLVPRGDSAAAARHIIQLARDPELRNRMGGAGRRLAEAEFDVRKNTAAVLRLYGLS
jgi:glycosyltransferase involved in cell wall biosynthesis